MISSVDGKLFRGPRPQRSDFVMMRSEFKTVISLEGTEEDEKEKVELAPIPLIEHPISFSEIYFTGISPIKLTAILHSIAVEDKPIFLHCQHGEDRTGLVVACYRVTCCDWTPTKAFSEALAFGYRNWLNFGLNKTWDSFKAFLGGDA